MAKERLPVHRAGAGRRGRQIPTHAVSASSLVLEIFQGREAGRKPLDCFHWSLQRAAVEKEETIPLPPKSTTLSFALLKRIRY